MTSGGKIKIIADADIPFLRGRLEPLADVTYVDQFGFTPKIVADADVLLIRTRTRCNAALLEGSSVKMIATATIGMDQINTAWCEKAGIEVRNAPGCNAPGVAQYVWSALLRMDFDPSYMTLGIVGCGNVGSIVALWGKYLGARILINDPPRETELKAKGYNVVPLDSLLSNSDAVTLHTPLTRSGKYPSFHLLTKREIAIMKPGSILVNAARGPVVDNAAFANAIGEGRIRGVVDTWEGEPEVNRDLLLLAHYATYHIAGYSLEGKQRATRMALTAIADRFSLPIDLSDLEPPYLPSELTATDITESYDPQMDTDALRAKPELFDKLRANYNFRKEPIHREKS